MMLALYLIGGALVASGLVVILFLRMVDFCQPLDPDDPD